jgi:ABC-type polar amino acid transport system ATPase subunit
MSIASVSVPAPQQTRVAPKLEARGITKFYTRDGNRLPVLQDFSLAVAELEFLVLLGPSGCGKSTLLRIIDGIEPCDAGQIILDGKDVTGTTGSGRGMVFQGFELFPWRTVMGNVAFGLEVAGVGARERTDIAREYVNLVGLNGFENSYPHELSGGMQQRVGIARALAMRPDLLLFDEPTSALDPELVGEVLVVMRDLAREGMTMVIVTHEMGFAREAATRVLFLDRGRAVETGAPDRFFSNPETERARQFLQRYAGDTAAGRR